jgi:hypothetical protein
MANLKQDHNYLYKRVRLKAILHTGLGLVLIIFPLDKSPSGGAVSTVQLHLGDALTIFGWLYLLIGILIWVGIYTSKHNYRWTRLAMFLAVVYNTIWLTILFAILAQRTTRSIAYIIVLYTYLTYNCWLVFRDPGWEAIKVVKEIKEREDERLSSVN